MNGVDVVAEIIEPVGHGRTGDDPCGLLGEDGAQRRKHRKRLFLRPVRDSAGRDLRSDVEVFEGGGIRIALVYGLAHSEMFRAIHVEERTVGAEASHHWRHRVPGAQVQATLPLQEYVRLRASQNRDRVARHADAEDGTEGAVLLREERHRIGHEADGVSENR